jgi:hypothetical protein
VTAAPNGQFEIRPDEMIETQSIAATRRHRLGQLRKIWYYNWQSDGNHLITSLLKTVTADDIRRSDAGAIFRVISPL